MGDVWASIQGLVQKHLAPRPAGAAEPHRYALDRAVRIVRTIDLLTPLVGREAADSPPLRPDLVRIAALYACIPLAGPARGRATDDLGDAMELAADQLVPLLSAEDVELVLRILREYRQRTTTLGDAQLLSDAIGLEDVGLVGLWNQMRSFHTAGRTLDQVIRLWKTQREYGYWETRLRDDFHFGPARRVAQTRLESLAGIYVEMQRQQMGEDIR
jgi:hypothetical protein